MKTGSSSAGPTSTGTTRGTAEKTGTASTATARTAGAPAGAGRGRVPVGARILVVVVALALGWHFLATYTWNASPNATRTAIGNEALASYMIPMFGQSWSVFAPNPGSVNQELEVRAIVTADGAPTTTDWYSLTARSADDDVQGHLVPSRMYLNDFILANRYYDSFLAMDPTIREQAGKDYLGDGWAATLKTDLLAAYKMPANPVVDLYVRYEQTTLGLASEVAHARWGDGVTRVQVRILKTPVVPFAQRGTDAKPAVSYFVDGWRAPQYVAGLDRGVFDSMFAEGGAK